jgi:hypothetical protein
MIRIHKLKRPTKRSGHPLEPGKTAKVKGITIINTTSQVVYVDRYSTKTK